MALTTKEGGAKHKSAPKMMPQPCNAKSRTPKAHSEGFALSQLPIEVPYHSVIGQRRPGPRERGSDGVVPYWSSHLDEAQCRLQLNRRLRALGVNGDEAELRIASDGFRGHCLTLTLLGSYLTDAYHETFVAAKKYPRVLLTTFARESMPEKSWSRTKAGLVRALSWQSSGC